MNLVLFRKEEIIHDTNEHDKDDNHDLKNRRIILDSKDERYKHIRKHLRKSDGDSVRIGIINDSTGTATLRQKGSQKEEEGEHEITLEELKLVPLDPNLPKVDLILGMMQPQTLKRLWPVLASLGLNHITISGGDLCDEAYKDSSIITPKIYKPLLLQGLSQSTIPFMPTVNIQPTINLKETIMDTTIHHTKSGNYNHDDDPIWIGMDIGMYPSIRTIILQNVAKRQSKIVPRVILTIGPERGYTEQEIDMMRQKGLQLASMGPWIQRTDVACITSIALVMDTLQELQKQCLKQNEDQLESNPNAKKKIKLN